jgi:DNA-binding CsgD family transcriptional regulator
MSEQFSSHPSSPSHVDTHLRAAVWDSLVLDPTIGVAIVREDGFTVYCNKRTAEIMGGDGATPEKFIGKPWSDYFPKDWIEERLRILAEIKRTGKPVLLRTIWHGKQHFSQIRAVPDREGDEKQRFLVVTRRQPSEGVGLEAVAGTEVVMSEVAGFGKLDPLTDRELEVLALIGQGLTSKEIAKFLHRSEKTVENHRYALSKKLQGASAVELSSIATQAGLDVSDSKRTRV